MKKKTGKYVAAASAMALLMGAVGAVPTMASTNPTAHKIADVLGIKQDLGEYANAVNKEITKGGITFELGEVIIDNEAKELVVSTKITTEEKIKDIIDTDLAITDRVYINGMEINGGAAGTTNVIDEHTAEAVITYYLPSAIEGDADVKIRYATGRNVGAKELNSWEFEFTADGEELAADTVVVHVNKQFTFDNGKKITLDRYTSNGLGDSIYYSTNDDLNNYIYKVEGTDNLGNKVVFDFFFGNTAIGGEFQLNKAESNLAADAQSMELSLYALELPKQDGPITGEYKQVGESFVIEVQ